MMPPLLVWVLNNILDVRVVISIPSGVLQGVVEACDGNDTAGVISALAVARSVLGWGFGSVGVGTGVVDDVVAGDCSLTSKQRNKQKTRIAQCKNKMFISNCYIYIYNIEYNIKKTE